MNKELGKIAAIRLGAGGYQDAMIGISFKFEGQGWSVQDFWGCWRGERDNHALWTEQDRLLNLGDMVMRLNSLFIDAKVSSLEELVGIPVEVTFEDIKIKSWRILKEVR